MEDNINNKSIEHHPSETAMATAFMRALAWYDKREDIKGHDNLAEIFLPEDYRRLLKDHGTIQWVIKNKTDPGAYEFMIARTAFFDQIVQQKLTENIPQIVFLGAGYDTRPYRFRELIQDTRIFELDAPPTQQRKKEILQQAGIAIPEQLSFIPVDFQKDDIKVTLLEADFKPDLKTLFVWEGVTYYLSMDAVNNTLNFIKTNSLPGSSVCFDYASLSPEALNNDSVSKIRKRMKTRYSGEPTRFGIIRGNLKPFLSERGYHIIEHLSSTEMQQKYLTLPDNSSAGAVPPLFCLVHASI
jgi:methyltransferase (TIGR00027 family)